MIFRGLTIALAALVLAGCANKFLKPEGVTEASLTSSHGILVGSFSRNPKGKTYYSQTFYFKNIKTNEIHEIKSQPEFNIFGGKTPDDFKTEESKGGVFAFVLPAGQYIFNNFRLYQASGSFQQNWRSKEDYSIPFDIHPNATNYIGEIKLDPATGKNFFGMTVLDGGIWIISDQWKRDVELLKRLRSEIPVNNVFSVVPNKKEVFTPLVVLPNEMNEYLRRKGQ